MYLLEIEVITATSLTSSVVRIIFVLLLISLPGNADALAKLRKVEEEYGIVADSPIPEQKRIKLSCTFQLSPIQ